MEGNREGDMEGIRPLGNDDGTSQAQKEYKGGELPHA